jgi:NADH-quinone oxidoreductase subunit G
VVLPAASWAEASGTYVNYKGIHQVSEKALEPLGSSKPAWQQLSEIGQALGLDAAWTKLKQIRAKLNPPATTTEASAPPAE